MIAIYPAGQTDFSRHGITLHPTSCVVTWQALSRYDLDLVLPLIPGGPKETEAALLAFDRIIYASVPPMYIPAINMGLISYWRVPADASENVPLYKSLGYSERVSYQAWVPGRSYMQGDKVTDSNQNYQCSTGHGGVMTPPAQNPTLWNTISNYRWVPGTVLAELAPGALLTKLADFNQTYMRAANAAGQRGFVEIGKVEQMGNEEPWILPARTITHQPFLITGIRKKSASGEIAVHAVHLSYLLNAMLLGDCNLVSASPGTALAFFQGAMMEAWTGLLATNLQEPAITQDFSWKMAGDGLMNPRTGLAALLNAKLIRDGQDLLLLENAQESPAYAVRYGVNLRGVEWKGDIDKLVSRVYPRAKAADDTPLMLPEMYVESERPMSNTRMERLDVKLKVGATEEQTDGTAVTLTEEIVLARMREAAENRFAVDKCDQPAVSLDVDFIRMGDTEEYAQYKGLEKASPYDWLDVQHGPMDISAVAQMIGCVWDSKQEQYQKASFGDARRYVGRTVTDWDLRSGAVTADALSEPLKKKLGV